ncbi:MAG: deoxynucleoside kinase [Anaerolineales bacterium]|nr:deoxynucleoside kinase [Anaerolineales bacterium]
MAVRSCTGGAGGSAVLVAPGGGVAQMGKLIAVIGNSGVGKTTLTKAIAAREGFTPACEQHGERPFQHAMARDSQRYALANQLDYLLFRAEQEYDLRNKPTIGVIDGGLDLDFYGFTHLFWQRGYLDDAEFGLCARQYHLLRTLLGPPDLYIHLAAPLSPIRSRFEQRGRPVEIAEAQDLMLLDELITAWVQQVEPQRLLTLDAGGIDFCDINTVAAVAEQISTWEGGQK